MGIMHQLALALLWTVFRRRAVSIEEPV